MVSAEIAVAMTVHPPHSPNQSPSDFFLLPKMKEQLSGKRFANDEDLKDAVVTWLNSQAATLYSKGIHKLVPRYDKCLNVKGDYVEKQTKICAKTLYIQFLYYY